MTNNRHPPHHAFTSMPGEVARPLEATDHATADLLDLIREDSA